MPRRPLTADWASLSDDALLDVRMADLPIAIEGTLAARIAQLRDEMASARPRASRCTSICRTSGSRPTARRPIAVPFYLAHPRLEKLEEAQMLEVEGGEHEWGMRILRHEAGHAIDNAYRLRLRRQRREVFGSPSEPYPEFYTPKPYSKSFVLHLDAWYAQSHPDEDFAETFAVWLTPNSEWRQRYAGWPALRKLEYMDQLMGIAARRSRRAWTTRPRSIRCRACGRRCASTTAPSVATTAWTIRTSTTATCGASSRTSPSSAPTPRRRSSSPASGGRCARRWPAGPASTSTRSIRCSRT